MTETLEDYTTDPQQRSLFYAALHEPFPAWVMSQPVPQADEFAKKASAAFADPDRRLLPLVDASATFHSAIDYFAHVDRYPVEVGDRIKSACDFFNIGDDVAPYALLFADKLEKKAEWDDDVDVPGNFAINDMIDGVAYKLLPLDDEHDVAKSARELYEMAKDERIHYLMLRPAAINIVKAAADLGVWNTVPEPILDMGVSRLPDFEKAARAVKGRAAFVGGDQHLQDLYDAAIAEGDRGDITAEDCLQKIAAIDDAAGIQYRYHRGYRLPLPDQVIYGGPLVDEVEKAAKAHVCVRDVLIPLDEFRKIDADMAAYVLHKEASESFAKVRGEPDAIGISLAIMTWPEEDQRSILRLAAQA